MKTQPTEFPTEFRNDSDHGAIAMVFDALRSSKLAGTAAYYADIGEDDIPPCVAVWGRGLARWVIVAIDGEHRPVGKGWHRHTEHGWQEEISPMQQVIDAADHVQKDIQERTDSARSWSACWFSSIWRAPRRSKKLAGDAVCTRFGMCTTWTRTWN